MLALLVDDVTLLKGDEIAIHVRFRGGQSTSLTVEAPKTLPKMRKFKPAIIAQLDQLLETCTDQEAADRLNALGHRNWEKQPFTAEKVINIRFNYKLKSHYQRLRDRGLLRPNELAQRFGVSIWTVHEWGRAGLLPRRRYQNGRYLYEPVKPGTITRTGLGGRMIPLFTAPRRSTKETV